MPADLRFELVSADVRIVRLDSGRAQGFDFGKRRRRRTGPAVSRSKVKDFRLHGANSSKRRARNRFVGERATQRLSHTATQWEQRETGGQSDRE